MAQLNGENEPRNVSSCLVARSTLATFVALVDLMSNIACKVSSNQDAANRSHDDRNMQDGSTLTKNTPNPSPASAVAPYPAPSASGNLVSPANPIASADNAARSNTSSAIQTPETTIAPCTDDTTLCRRVISS